MPLQLRMLLVGVMLLMPCGVFAAESWEEFKTRMMPKVGKTITVSGKLYEGKDSPFVQLPNGEGRVNLRFKEIDDALMERNVKATGVLRYRERVEAPSKFISGIPEMFFLEQGGKVTLSVPGAR